MDTHTHEPASSFGMLLRRYRMERSLSQEELAARTGLSIPAISALERGVTQWPYRDTVVRLAGALELAPDERRILEAAARRPVRRPGPTPAPASASPPTTDATQVPRETRPATLPIPPTALIGRDAELDRMEQMLTQPGARLLTVSGPGGIGKTRLVIAAAHRLHGAYPDGVVFVELAPLDDGVLLPAAVAQALGVRDAPRRSLSEAISAAIGRRTLLLILDNCEHLIAACADLVAQLLAACTHLRVLATSRMPLRLRGEQVLPLAPLALPPAASPEGAAATLLDSPALALFVERATAINPAFTFSAANAADVAAICRRLDGLPLAIELAAAHCRYLAPRALLERLAPSLPLLSGGARDLPERQQTLRAAIAWSYDLLPAEAQRVFRSLAVCAGGCTLNMAMALGAEDPNPADPLAMLRHLEALAAASLLLPAGRGADEPRFAMLETIRDYGLERLDESGEGAAVRGRHLAWCLALAEQAEPELTGPQQEHWLARLEAEHNNIRAALHWALERHEAALGARLAGALWRFWFMRGHLSEGRRWLEAMLTLDRSGDGTAAAASPWAKVLNGAGMLASVQGDFSRAAVLLEDSLSLRRAAGDQVGIAAALGNLGIVAYYQGDYQRAAALHEESLALERECGDAGGIAASLDNLGLVALAQGAYERAATLYEESLALERERGDTWGIALVCNNLGVAVARLGDYARAAALHEESLALRRTLGDTGGMASSLNSLARVAGLQGDERRAADLYAESLRLCRDLDDKYEVACSLEGLAELACRQGQPRRAARLLGAASALRETIGMPLSQAERADNERTIAATRADLGEDAFAAASAAGQALTLEQAIAEALAETTGAGAVGVALRPTRPTAPANASTRPAEF